MCVCFCKSSAVVDVLPGGNEIIRLWASKGKQQLQLSVVTAAEVWSFVITEGIAPSGERCLTETLRIETWSHSFPFWIRPLCCHGMFAMRSYSFPVANCLSHYFCFLLYSFYEFVYMYFGNIFISYVGPNKSESGRWAIQCQMMVPQKRWELKHEVRVSLSG